MRILFATDRLSTRGGADLHLLQIIRWARRRGWAVRMEVGRIDPDAEVPEGVEVRACRGLASSTPTGRSLERLADSMRWAEVIHFQNIMNPRAIRLLVETGKAVATVQDHRVFCPGMGKTLPDGRPCRQPMAVADCSVCLDDDTYRERTEALTLDRLEGLRGASLIVLSHYMARELTAAGLPEPTIIPPWIDVSTPRHSPGRGFLLVGRMVRHKAPRDAWRAWNEAGRPEPLTVIGAGPEAEAMDGAERAGWLERDRVLEALAEARALLFPSLWQEPFGIVGVEALAQGTPVVAAVSGGMEDWCDGGCVRVKPGNIEGMTRAIAELAAEPDRARALGEAGRRMVADRFSETRIAPLIDSVYEQTRES